MLMRLVAGCVNGLVHTLAGWGVVDVAHYTEVAGVVAHRRERCRLQVFATAQFIINQRIFAMINIAGCLPIGAGAVLPIPVMLTGVKNNIAAGAPGLFGFGKSIAV